MRKRIHLAALAAMASTLSGPAFAQKLRYEDIPVYETVEPVRLEAELLNRWDAPEARQGTAADEEAVYAIVNHVIGRYDRETGALEQRWIGSRKGLIRHINSCFVENDNLVCANSNHPEVPMASSIEVFDKHTLKHRASHSLGLMDEGSLVWFDRLGDSWVAGFAHYNDETGLPYKTNAYAGVYTFDSDWRKTGGWMLPNALVDLMAPQAASGGEIGPDGLLYLMGHDRTEMYVVAKPVMGPKLIHIATIDIEAEGQAFAFDTDGSRKVFAISRPNGEIREFKLPAIPEDALKAGEATRFR
ncbi:hypothetical protein [Henriciella aquimarina]|uniref:hypothetical protein n=1 Tax=Henriciella aquimarina TaxID=545261 RepID=UPI001179BCBA|nr:hypothetical protein [Henriciella aquimarina]